MVVCWCDGSISLGLVARKGLVETVGLVFGLLLLLLLLAIKIFLDILMMGNGWMEMM